MISDYSGHVVNPNNQQQNNRSNSLQSSATERNAFGHQASHGNANNNTNLAAILPLLLQLIIVLIQQLIGNKGNDDTGSDQHNHEQGVMGEDGDREGALSEVIGRNAGDHSDQGAQTQPAFTIDLNKDGVTSAGDLIVDPTNRVAQEIGSISPVVGGLQDLETRISQQQNFEANLSDDERKSLEEKGKASQFDVISLVPKNIVGTTIPSQDANRHFAIDINRDGTFSSGDLLVDLDSGEARRVNVDPNPVVNDLNGLQAQMEEQRDHINNLSEDEFKSAGEKAEANRFDLLGPGSFSTG